MVNSVKTFLKQVGKDYQNQSVNPPVVRASTIIFKSMQDIKKTQNRYLKNPVSGNFDYGRQGTPTTYALQQILRKLEECYKVYLTPTGFGAVFLGVLSVIEPEDEILVTDSVYSPTRLLIQTYLKADRVQGLCLRRGKMDLQAAWPAGRQAATLPAQAYPGADHDFF